MSYSRPISSLDARPSDTFWGRRRPLTRHAVSLGLLFAIAAAFFAPAIFGGKAVHGSDVVAWRASAEAVLEYQERTGELALWVPNVFSGMPAFLVKYNIVVPQLDTVLNALRPILWPASHLFAMLAGVYLLVFYLVRNHFSGLLSAIGFGFTTYIPIIFVTGHGTKFVALAFAPYVLLAFVYTLRNPSLLSGLLFAGALAINLRAKHPQITYSVLMLALVWWVVELIFAWQDEEIAPFAKSTGWLALGTGLGLLMVAQPYLGIYQYKQYSVRGASAAAGAAGEASSMGWEKAMQWSQGPKELLTLVIANTFGGGGGTYWGPKVFTEGPHYVGGVIAAFSGLAVWRRQNRVTWGIAAGVLATVLFSLGKYAEWINWPMFAYFPFFDAFRAPETWLSISALGLAVLAGVGLDYAMRDSGERRSGKSPRTSAVLYVFGSLLAVVLLLRVGPNLFLDFEKSNERQRLERAIQQQRPDLSVESRRVQQFIDRQIQKRKGERRTLFTSDATRTLIALGVVLLLIWLYRRRNVSAWVAGGLIVLVVTIDLWGVAGRYVGDDSFSSKTEEESQIPTYNVDRFIKERVKEAGGPGHFRALPLQTPYTRNPIGGNAAFASYHYESIGGYHAAKLQIYQEYLDHILQITQRGIPNENGLDLMNARYVVAKQQLPGTNVVYRDDQTGTLVLENPDAVPRGFFVGQTDVVTSPEATWARLRDPSFNPRTMALLPEPLDSEVAPIGSGSTTNVTLESYEPPEIKWTVETDEPRLFVASEVYYPAGWNAYLDGTKVPIHRVDYLLRGVHVPEGRHTLVMRFEPKVHEYGVWISAVATVVDYGGILVLGTPYLRRRLLPWAEDEESKEDE